MVDFKNLSVVLLRVDGMLFKLNPISLLNGNGIQEIYFHTFSPQKYLLYPANISSPASPDKATVTFSFAILDTRYVGI